MEISKIYWLAIIGFVIAWLISLSSSVGRPDAPVTLTIPSGASVSEIAQILKGYRLIRFTALFKVAVAWEGLNTSLRAGRFEVDPSLNLREIAKLLAKSQDGEVRVTIPEGFTIADIDARLAGLGLIEAGEFIRCVQTCSISTPDYVRSGTLEGFLFPDTYFVSRRDFTAQEFAQRMLQEMATHIAAFSSELESSGRSIYEVITMASIIEREVRTEKDYATVAGILWKRLDGGWPLGADATLLYAMVRKTISAADLDADSPYNTRKNVGLPPTPIANPGLKSLRAALMAEDSPYWFYLTKRDSGEVVYAKTNEEHNQNRLRYLP